MTHKRLGIGFIGGGFITRFHIQSLIAVRDVDVMGVVSRTKESAEESAALARTIGVGNDVVELCIQVATGQGFVARPGFYSAVGCHNLP